MKKEIALDILRLLCYLLFFCCFLEFASWKLVLRLAFTLAPVPRKVGPDRRTRMISERAEAAVVRLFEEP